jgi:REP element-mobilizing transposase RayT
MAQTGHYFTQFAEGEIYHIYNRSVGKQLLFRNDGNFLWFLKQYQKYLDPVVSTLAYCLMGNHFHFLIKVKTRDEMFAHARTQELSTLKLST